MQFNHVNPGSDWMGELAQGIRKGNKLTDTYTGYRLVVNFIGIVPHSCSWDSDELLGVNLHRFR